MLKTFNEGIDNTANRKGGMDGQIWKGLKRIMQTVVSENLLAEPDSFSEFVTSQVINAVLSSCLFNLHNI